MAGAPLEVTPYIYSTHTSKEFSVVFLRIMKEVFAKTTGIRAVRVSGQIDGKKFDMDFRELSKSISFSISDHNGWPESGHSGAGVPIYSLHVEDKKYRPLRLRKYKSLVRDLEGVSAPKYGRDNPPPKKVFEKSLALVENLLPSSKLLTTKPGK